MTKIKNYTCKDLIVLDIIFIIISTALRFLSVKKNSF